MSVVTRIRTSQELTVPFPPHDVWAVLSDVAAYPDWWPAKLGVQILHHPGELLGAEFEVRPMLGRMFCIRFEELESMRCMRLRFFGGSLEGPGGFHFQDLDGATRVRYEMDVFSRGLDVAVLSQVLPLERIHQSRMRSVLRSLAVRLKTLRKAADRLAAQEARSVDREEAIRRRAEEDAALRLAEEAARRQAEREEAVRAVAEEAERQAAEEEAARLAAEGEARKQAEAEEAARQAAEAEARKRAEEEAAERLAAEEEERRAAKEAARHAAEVEERRRADEETLRRAAAEAVARFAAEEAERRVEREAAARAVAHEATPDVSGDVDHAAAAKRATGSRPRPLWGRIVNWLTEAPVAAPTPSVPAEESADQPAAGPRLSNFDIARLYLEALSSRATPDEIGQFFAPEAAQEEFPHRFLETTVRRGFAGILEARSGALTRFGSQRYELTGATGGGSQVAMEVRWKGSVATPGEGFTEGQELDAGIAIFLKFEDGKIVRERNYACFEPWSTRAERLLTLDERVAQAGQSTQAPTHGPGHAPMEPRGSNLEMARSYLDALGARADAETIARFHAADAVHDEFPNPFLPGGAHRDLQAIKLARSRGIALMASESYELMGATGGSSQVALEVAWSGVVGEGLGLFPVGQRLEARLGIFLKFRDGLIVSQSNYACASLNAPAGM